MLHKKQIDKKLKNYIKVHLSNGYSKHSIKKVLVDHGYHESYIDGLLNKHSEIQFVKKYAVIVSLLFIFSFLSFNLISIKQQKITGYVTSGNNEGCCASICRYTSQIDCIGNFIPNKNCNELEECNVGCCIDREGYCLTNYLQGNCLTNYGRHIHKDCNDLPFCRNITDTSYTAREYNIKDNKIFSEVKPLADYYGSVFNLKYYLYDTTNAISVVAKIKENDQLIDSLTLYDDGSHNDGAKHDNVYGSNWLSSKLSNFNGFKKLDVDIVINYIDSSQQLISNAKSFVVLKGNKCLPISEWNNPGSRFNIIFAAYNYDNFDDGYQRFVNDAQSFLSALFSLDKFSSQQDNFNIYRFEKSLSYTDTAALQSSVAGECPSYSNSKDLIVILDNNEENCINENNRVIRVNSSIWFYKNITQAGINESFADLCSYILTPKKLANEIINFATPPEITVYTLDNESYNLSSINLSFSVSAINYPINNSVFIDDVMIFNNVTAEPTNQTFEINLTNGTNVVLVQSIDKNENEAYSQLLINTTIK